MLRKAVFKGSWYPGALEELDEMVSVDGSGDYRAAVLPHSGLFYSAPLISDFFKGLSDAVKRIVIISPSHYYPLESNRLYVSDFSLSETPYGNIKSLDEFTLGKDGLMMNIRGWRAVFLPSVAEETGWDEKTFFEQLSLKAGLGKDAYLDEDASFEIFQAEVIA